MDISLAPELEKLVRSKVKNGEYANESEVLSEALRKAFSSRFDPEQDTPELAEMISEARRGPYSPFDPNEFKRLSEQILSGRPGRK
jgi:putative addiction module CopG family antidote